MLTSILLIIVIIFLFRNLLQDLIVSNPLSSSSQEEPIVAGKFTPHSLQKFNGTDDPKIFISVRNRVFDVSQGATFYGPGGPYENFAGRDASRGLAFNSFEKDLLTSLDDPIDDLKDLTKDQLESLDSWEEHFENKYKVVGTLVEEEAKSKASE